MTQPLVYTVSIMSDDYSVNSIIPAGGLRDRLVEHALALLERGETDISLRGVARAAGVSAMAPYRHFPDKASLVGAVATHGFGSLRQLLERADADAAGGPGSALIAQGIAYVRFARDRPALFRLMFADPVTTTLSAGCDAAAYDVLARRVESLVPDTGTAASACWAIVHGLAILTLDGRISPDEREWQRVLELFVAGVFGDSDRSIGRPDI